MGSNIALFNRTIGGLRFMLKGAAIVLSVVAIFWLADAPASELNKLPDGLCAFIVRHEGQAAVGSHGVIVGKHLVTAAHVLRQEMLGVVCTEGGQLVNI